MAPVIPDAPVALLLLVMLLAMAVALLKWAMMPRSGALGPDPNSNDESHMRHRLFHVVSHGPYCRELAPYVLAVQT